MKLEEHLSSLAKHIITTEEKYQWKDTSNQKSLKK